MTRASDLAHRLARDAEAVCRRYLSNGHREGRYWMVGDARNSSGRSMFVRLHGTASGKGAAGKWTDAATGEHGDLLDVIRESCDLSGFREAAEEARRFLSLPRDPPPDYQARWGTSPGAKVAARRLFAMSRPIPGTLAERYLNYRGITGLSDVPALRYHPECYYRPDRLAPREIWPAMIAAVTEQGGQLTGIHRTWLSRDGTAKAPIETPRRAMGSLLGHAVRFGLIQDVAAAGEGIETMLSLRTAIPAMPMLAGLSAAHLAAILFPGGLRRLYIALDKDSAGEAACARLGHRAATIGIETIVLVPQGEDFNDDLRHLGIDRLRAHLADQLSMDDYRRFV